MIRDTSTLAPDRRPALRPGAAAPVLFYSTTR